MNNIDRARFNPVFVTVSEEGPLREIIDSEIPFHSLRGKRVSMSALKLYSKLKELKPDIVISTMAHLNLTLLLLSPLFPKTRFIVREAITPSFILEEHQSLSFMLRIAYRILYPKAAQVISPAQIIIDEFKELLHMSCKNHILLYNPVDLDRIRLHETKSFKVPEESKNAVNFVAAGRLHHQKGFDRLIEALPDMKHTYNWHLTIWGEGSERENLQTLIDENGLSDKISLPGLSVHPWPHFAMADCFIMPSRWEGLPNVILESLACGTPVIATRESGGIAEISNLAEEGVVKVVDNIAEFIDAMQKVKPDSVEMFRPSLLPDSFEKKNVISRFERILSKVAS